MRTMHKCNECHKYFYGEKCICGWNPSTSRSSPSDDKCAYIFEGRRCPLYGTVRSNSAWYCSGHLAALGDYHGGRAALKFAEDNYAEIIHERKCVNDLVFHINCERCKEWRESKKTKAVESKNYSPIEKRNLKPPTGFIGVTRRLGTALLPIVQPSQNFGGNFGFNNDDRD